MLLLVKKLVTAVFFPKILSLAIANKTLEAPIIFDKTALTEAHPTPMKIKIGQMFIFCKIVENGPIK